jgi:hypothetical protein
VGVIREGRERKREEEREREREREITMQNCERVWVL